MLNGKVSSTQIKFHCSAYIAASRRSDRSLEARVESARRASEIHKKRTGRSLRVTEQDVVNEEMYEEEDDDLPMQYRRLTAHLQTGSADFNRRLSAYLTHHVAMRSALDQAITSSYAQKYPNAPQFAHNHQASYPSPFFAHNLPPQHQQHQQHQQQQQHHQQQTPQPFVQPPYNILTGTPSFRSVQQMRSASVAVPQGASTLDQSIPTASPVQSNPLAEQRESSMPTQPVSPTGSAQTQQAPQFVQPRTPPQQSPQVDKQTSPPHAPKTDQITQTSPSQMYAPPLYQQPPTTYGMLGGYPSFGPLTTALPTESQLMLGSVLDPNDPMTAMFMAGSEHLIQPFHNPMSPTHMKAPQLHPSYDGMSATLAPSALDMPTPGLSNLPPTGSTSLSTPFSSGLEGGLLEFKGPAFTRSNSSQGSGTGTPGLDAGWDAFINENSWGENVT